MLITSTDETLNSSIISCLHYFCIKLKKRLLYIKDPSTFCVKGTCGSYLILFFFKQFYKDFYGDNNIESLYAASTATFNNQNVINGNNQAQDLNMSVYSQHSSVISTIKSGGDSSRQPANKENHIQPLDNNLCQDLQV